MQKINHVYGPYSLLLLGEEEDVWSPFVHIHFDEGFFFFDNLDGGDFDLLCSIQFDLVIYFSS